MRRLLTFLLITGSLLAQQTQQTFRITPVRPVEELRREALAAKPPVEKGKRAPDLVELVSLDPTIKLDIRYATTDNFLGTKFYDDPRAFLQRPAAEALARAHRKLRAQGYGLLIHDAYRPWYVTKMFWEATPADKKDYVANPADGSRHNRGCAADLTLYDLRTGEPVTMPSGYDEMTERAHPDYKGGTAEQTRHREILRKAMENEGFEVYQFEWWHFDYKDWEKYPIMNLKFNAVDPSYRSLYLPFHLLQNFGDLLDQSRQQLDNMSHLDINFDCLHPPTKRVPCP